MVFTVNLQCLTSLYTVLTLGDSMFVQIILVIYEKLRQWIQ